MDYFNTIRKLGIETLKEAIKPVVFEKREFQIKLSP